ncbi:MAG: hypothetical protein EBT47_02195, partial [Chloroflexi bacterium]|nr:hypothetical protein [Chloroflexota bacterium]
MWATQKRKRVMTSTAKPLTSEDDDASLIEIDDAEATPEDVGSPENGAHSEFESDSGMGVSMAIRTRRTIRRWTDRPVAPEVVKELLECALWAPSACNMQLWDFVVITDKATRDALAPAVPHADKAQVCIFICYNTRFSQGSYANIQSASAAVMNMLLRAHSLGLGGFWQATITDRLLLREILRLPRDVEVLSTTLFGYPAESPGAPARRDPSHLVHWEKYDLTRKPVLPSAWRPTNWTLAQVADYHQARIRAGPRYNKPVASEYRAVRGYLGHALRRAGVNASGKVVVDLLPCTGLYLEAMSNDLPTAERRRLLAEARRILKPGGTLVVVHTNVRSYFEVFRAIRWLIGRRDVQYALHTDPSLGPFEALSNDEVSDLLVESGFRIEHRHGAFPLPPPDEAKHRVRALPRAVAPLAGPLGRLYELTAPLHRFLRPFARVRFI